MDTTEVKRPDHKTIKLVGHLLGERGTLEIRIDWHESINALKEEIKRKAEIKAPPQKITLYKLGRGDDGIPTLDMRTCSRPILEDYRTALLDKALSHTVTMLNDTVQTRKYWPEISNSFEVTHFVVVVEQDTQDQNLASMDTTEEKQPDHEIIKLVGHLLGKHGTFEIRIDWHESINALKEEIKRKAEIKAPPQTITLYKLGRGDDGIPTLDMRTCTRPILEDYRTALLDKALSHTITMLNDTAQTRKYWPKISNSFEVTHFVVVVEQDIQVSSQVEVKDLIDNLTQDLHQWCESSKQAAANSPQEPETLRTLGYRFPLQQCLPIIRRLKNHMLDSFRLKFVNVDYPKEWRKSFFIPIVGAASGTGKSAICSRFLGEIATRASEHNSPRLEAPPSSAVETLDAHGQPEIPKNIHAIQTIIADFEGQLPEADEYEDLPLNKIWDEARLASFHTKVKESAKHKLTLTLDLMASLFDFNTKSTLETSLAAALLDAYSRRFTTKQIWQQPTDLTSKFRGVCAPLHIALRVLRALENDNIIIIHLDETQAVPSGNLQTLVKLLVQQMDPNYRDAVPWIFPILSGLSLETLLDSSKVSGAKVKRYTPPVLSIASMLNIARELFYVNNGTDGKIEQPVFQKGFIQLLHDLRGPTRYFQAVLLFIQNFSGVGEAQKWSLEATVDIKAIRAGLEKHQDWSCIFDRLARLTCQDDFIKDIGKLRKNTNLFQRLFDLNLLGEKVSLAETFNVAGEEKPLSFLFEYGWANIVDATDEHACTIFLPFLTLYGVVSDNPSTIHHPGLIPLCKVMDWKTIEKEDARMLQYRLTRRSMSSDLRDTALSDLFGEVGDVTNQQFRLNEHPWDFEELKQKVDSIDALTNLAAQNKQMVYLNGPLAQFVDNFALLQQPDSSRPHVLGIQFLQATDLTITNVRKEYKKVADVCSSNFPFTLVIVADRVSATCRKSLAKDATLKSSVLILEPAGFNAFYGKPLSFRRRLFSGLDNLPEQQAQVSQDGAEAQTITPTRKRKRSSATSDFVSRPTDHGTSNDL